MPPMQTFSLSISEASLHSANESGYQDKIETTARLLLLESITRTADASSFPVNNHIFGFDGNYLESAEQTASGSTG